MDVKCEKCRWCGEVLVCDGCKHDPDLKDRYEPQTNADRIRSMSDKELAEFLEGEYGNMMPGTALMWLQQAAEEEHHADD